MLLVPLVLGIAAAGAWHPRVLAVVVAAVVAFISRQSLAIALRERQRGRDARPAGRDFVLQAGIALACGVWLVADQHLVALLPMAAAGVLLLGMQAVQLRTREQRTLTAEVLAILGLTMTAPASFTACRGAWSTAALWLWGTCVVYFSSSVFYVKLRVLKLAARRDRERRVMFAATAVYHAALALGLGILVSVGIARWQLLPAFAPILVRSAAALAQPAGKLDLKRTGITEIVYSLNFLVWTALAFRNP